MAQPPSGEAITHRCHLPDGRTVDLLTRSGADTLVRTVPTFLHDEIRFTLDPIRAGHNNGLNPSDREMLVHTYTLIGVATDRVSPKVLQEVISSNDMDLWVKHVATILQQLTEDPRWIRTGVLAPHDQQMLEALTPTVKHYGMVQRMMIGGDKQNFLNVLANFIRARRGPLMPCFEVAEQICDVAGNIQFTLQQHHLQQLQHKPKSEDDAVASDQAFRRLEDSGLLAQTLRCWTVPPATTSEDADSHRLYFLDELLKRSVQMRRRLTPTSPTGTILQAILNGKDGHPQCLKEISQRLKSLAQVCDYAARPISHLSTSGPSSTLPTWTCRFCNKTGSARELLLCSRCKDTYYCSKECQRSDWKAHKPSCHLYADRPIRAGESGRQNLILNWTERHYFRIMQELDRMTHLYRVPKRELILELDCYADEHGIAPALCTPSPIFQIGLAKEYLEGDRPAEPDWFLKGTDVYQNNIRAFLIALRDHYQRMTSNHLLTVLRYPTGNSAVHRVHLDCGHGSNKPMFSDAALEAFSRVMRHNDDGSLDQAFTPGIARSIRILYRDRCRGVAGRDPSFQDSMANIARQANAFPNSDLERQMRAEFGSDSDDDDDDDP